MCKFLWQGKQTIKLQIMFLLLMGPSGHPGWFAVCNLCVAITAIWTVCRSITTKGVNGIKTLLHYQCSAGVAHVQQNPVIDHMRERRGACFPHCESPPVQHAPHSLSLALCRPPGWATEAAWERNSEEGRGNGAIWRASTWGRDRCCCWSWRGLSWPSKRFTSDVLTAMRTRARTPSARWRASPCRRCRF